MNNRYIKNIGLLIFCIVIIPFTFSQTMDCGSNFNLTVCQNGTIQGWGNNTSGQLGNGSASNSNIPVSCSNLSGVISVSGGWSASYALKNDGTVWSWGYNSSGQLGIGSTTSSNIPVQVPGLTNVIQISSGWKHAVVLKSDGTVWAWGENYGYQLGNGTSTSSLVPVQVSGLTNIVKVVAGDRHNLALTDNGSVWAWGTNGIGQYGVGTFSSQMTPILVTTIDNVKDIGAGYEHCIALKNDGTVWTWGAGGFGQIGNGTNNFSNIPVQVPGLINIEKVATTSGNYNLVVKNDGTCWSWGSNSYGQLGNGTTTSSNTPVQISGLSSILEISGGFENSMAKKSDGTIYTWGFGATGQLGNGTNSPSSIPVLVASACSGPVGFSDLSDSTISIYPNPLSDKFTVQTESVIISQIQIKDASGKLVYTNMSNFSTVEIDMTAFETGVYFVECMVEGERFIKKVIK